MPCNGVAVASGQIEVKLAGLLSSIPQEAIEEAVVALLRNQRRLPVERRAGEIVAGGYRVRIAGGNVQVTQTGRSGDAEALRDDLLDLLRGLAGMALQRQVIAALQATGAAVTGETRAPNGALVVGLEV